MFQFDALRVVWSYRIYFRSLWGTLRRSSLSGFPKDSHALCDAFWSSGGNLRRFISSLEHHARFHKWSALIRLICRLVSYFSPRHAHPARQSPRLFGYGFDVVRICATRSFICCGLVKLCDDVNVCNITYMGTCAVISGVYTIMFIVYIL